MGRQSKIEKFGLEKLITEGLAAGKSSRQIAELCSKKAKQAISHVAVNEYIKTIDLVKKKDVVVKEHSRVERITNFDLDIIELQYQTTPVLLERFEFINKLPEMFEQRFAAIQQKHEKDGAEADYLEQWKQGFVIELRRNIQNITSLNRELRENSKFMDDMRSKAFEFDLIQENLYLFMEVFRKADLEAYEIASAQIAANPRMLRIVEQQQQLRGGELE
ncbi:hypothetical protein QFZ77_004364 [Paenibacillus sp. V4I3]|uniref:hypothetical protein n=1 Tax=Paenibacillus sp. V4I3 TaxID=3042305 RepID=UPI00277DF8F9|nr:hypothetical protein [Paenibacillus sp. V4I3]MDQ0875705.1 hypothetical protein [Paenibacillus sp. V4I3]